MCYYAHRINSKGVIRMDNGNSVVMRKNYGGVTFCFREIMDAKNINRNQLATRAGIRFEVADRFYNGKIERIDIDVLARVCYVLDCDVGDVMKYDKQLQG